MIELLATLAQDPPPAIRHTHPPAEGRIEAAWVCNGRDVVYTIETSAYDIRLTGYSGVAGPATSEDLSRINRALQSIWILSGHSFTCNPDTDRLVLSGPAKRDHGEGEMTLRIEWSDGDLHLDVR